nr:hypothetical protein [Tanacetum cinerariifolium]
MITIVILGYTFSDQKIKHQRILKPFRRKLQFNCKLQSSLPPQQNRVMECKNRTSIEDARTMLIFCALLFLWAEAIATACYTQNRNPDISFLHVFEALCYPKNDREDIRKLDAKGDIGFFIGYSANSCAYRVYNRRTKKIIEMMNVTFDELSAMDFEQRNTVLTPTNSSSQVVDIPNTSHDVDEPPQQQHGHQQDNQAPL